MIIKQQIFASAIVYVNDVENTIENFLNRLYGVLHDNFEKFEIICVNDASRDSSKEIIRNLAGSFENCMLSVVNMSFYQGIEIAMRSGVDLAIGDFVFEFDGMDMDYEPSLIMESYNRSLQGFDIVSCGSDSRRFTSKLFYKIYNENSGTQYELRSESFRCMSRRAINRVHSMSMNIPYRKAQYSNCGLKADFIYYQSKEGKLNNRPNLKSSHDTALTSLILFTDIAYKTTLAFAFIMMLATFGSIIYVIGVYFTNNSIVGYTTTMILISGAFFALFAILAMVIKYLSVILGLVFHKQKYVIESIEKITG